MEVIMVTGTNFMPDQAYRALVYDCNLSNDNLTGVKDPVLNCKYAPGAVPIKSMADAVEGLRKKARDENIPYYDAVTFSGHGAPSFQSVGSGNDPKGRYFKGKDLLADNLEDIAKEIDALRSLMYQPANSNGRCPILFLGGCKVGEHGLPDFVEKQRKEKKIKDDSPNGAPLLKQLSQKMRNVCIIASTMEIAPLRNKDHHKNEVELIAAENGKT